MPVWFAVYLALVWSQIAFSSAPESMACHYKFEIQPDYFVDYFEAARQCPGKKLTTRPNLGLIDKSYNDGKQSQAVSETSLPWERFAAHIRGLNADSPDHVSYKVLFLMRHGLGVHNVFMEKVGGQAWRDYWSHLDGDGNVVFRDAKLVDQGVQQANILAGFWSKAVSELKVPLPETVYSSPLARCLETTRIVFSRLFEQLGQSLHPNIKELLRERLTDHTCDSRSSRTWIENNYPTFIIEPGFTENDELWKRDRSETPDEHVARKHTVLEDIFSNDPHQFIALTIHSYAMSAILRACGSEEFRIAEGSLVALVVRAEKIGASQLGTS